VDPVTFEVIRYSCMNTTSEHGQTSNGCRSPPSRWSPGFQPSILTESGDLVFSPYLQYSPTPRLTIQVDLENRSEEPGIGRATCSPSNDPLRRAERI